MPGDLYEKLRQTATAHVKAYESPKPFDSEEIWKWRTPDCVHFLHPTEQIPEAFRGAIEPDKHRYAMQFFGSVIETCKLEIQELAVDVSQKMVVARIIGVYDFKAVGDEPAERDVTADYMWLTEMNASGEKIKRVEECLNTELFMTKVRGKAEKFAELNKS